MSKSKRKLTPEQIQEQIKTPITREGKRLDLPKRKRITRDRLMDELESRGD